MGRFSLALAGLLAALVTLWDVDRDLSVDSAAAAPRQAARAEARPRPQVPLGYNATVEFLVDYEVKWTEKTGQRSGSCSFWSEVEGVNGVLATNRGKPMKAFVSLNTPSVARRRHLPWANVVAVGAAEGGIYRRRHVTGGYTAGCSPPRSWSPPADDCDRADFTTRTATLLFGAAALDGTLDYADETIVRTGDLNPLEHPVIALTVTPGGRPFWKCDSTRHAPEFPVNLALRVHKRNWIALTRLQPGKYVAINDQYAGACSASVPRTECSFDLVLGVTIKRTKVRR